MLGIVISRTAAKPILRVGAEHGCSIRRCTSVGSKRFILETGTVAPLTVQDCHVAEWTDAEAAVQLNGSPVLMFDCAFTHTASNRIPVKAVTASQKLLLSNNRPASSRTAGGGHSSGQALRHSARTRGRCRHRCGAALSSGNRFCSRRGCLMRSVTLAPKAMGGPMTRRPSNPPLTPRSSMATERSPTCRPDVRGVAFAFRHGP